MINRLSLPSQEPAANNVIGAPFRVPLIEVTKYCPLELGLVVNVPEAVMPLPETVENENVNESALSAAGVSSIKAKTARQLTMRYRRILESPSISVSITD